MCDGLYARQSVDKKDSISVESQLEYCKYEAKGNNCIEYADRGFSGKDTNRPAFENMMKDIALGKINRVIVYKLDRISRSILDFAKMMETFQKYNVEFVSSTEKFDTSTPIGRAMLNICIVFAQLERETIQKRVSDSYYARSKRGFYMGGRVPYGYKLKNTVIDNIKTSMYEVAEEESQTVKLIYKLYTQEAYSLGNIVRYLNDKGIKNKNGQNWSSSRIGEMIRNPVYVVADIDIYNFFKDKGASVYNPPEDYIGENSCYVYNIGGDRGLSNDFLGKEVILAPHKGFIDAKTWINARERMINNRQSAKTCKSKNSWLTGKVKCGNCGYALVVRKAKTKWERYFVCSGHKSMCKGTGSTVYADVLEKYIQDKLQERLIWFVETYNHHENRFAKEINKIKISMAQLDNEMQSLVSKIPDASPVLMQYINSKAEELDFNRRELDKKLDHITKTDLNNNNETFGDYKKFWGSLSYDDKQEVADIFIKIIKIYKDRIEIVWNI